MPAFEAAVAMGYTYIETDVHVTSDGVAVAFHDAELDRVTDKAGAIAALTIADVEGADAGHTFTADHGLTFPFRGQDIRVPRLDALLKRWPDVRVNLDIKADDAVDTVMALVKEADAFDRVCIGAFSDSRLARVRSLGGDAVCTSMGPRAVARARFASLSGRFPAGGADCVQVPLSRKRIRIIDRAFVRAAHGQGIPVHVWTVNDVPTMNRLLDMGIDGIMTDTPRALRDVYARHGFAVDGSRPRVQ